MPKFLQKYLPVTDILGHFLQECTIAKTGSKVQAKDLYTRYVEWCRASNEVPDNKTRFGLDMKKRLQKVHDGRHIYYADIALTLSVNQFVQC